MKLTTPIAATVLLAALVLTGCSAGSLPGSSSSSAAGSKTSGSGSGGSGSGGGSNNGPTRDYTADDLVAILKKVESTQNLTGTIRDNAQIKALQSGTSSKSLSNTFTSEGAKVEPAVCGTLLDKLVSDGETFEKNNSSYVSASLSATSDILNVGSTQSGDANAIIATIKSVMSQVTSQCSTMTIGISGSSAKFTVASVPLTSNASQTFGYEEDFTVEGQAVKTLTVEAVYGNLVIGDVSITSPSAARQEANINAVISAAG